MITGESGITICYILLAALNTLCFIIHINPNLQVLFQTPLIVYIGAVHSIRLYSKTTDTKKEGIETMTKKDAMLFPIIAGVTLGSLYLAFKFLDKDWVNFLFQFYFTIAGIAVITSFLYNRTKEGFPELTSNILFTLPQIKFITDAPTNFDVLYTLLMLVSSPIGIGYLVTKHYMLNNILGIFFSLFGIESFLLGSCHIGFILLSALFFYDIYFVFFTPLMVTVAKNLDGPIKLMFPKIWEWESQKDFNMIGLGDIVLPGVFVALMFRFDYLRTLKNLMKKQDNLPKDKKNNTNIQFTLSNFNTFLWTFFGYFMGILSTLAIMNFFMHAQPALLYLVPGVLIFSSLAALVGGYFSFFFGYDENITLKELGIVEEEKKEKSEEAKTN